MASGRDFIALVEKVNNEFANIENYFRINKLSLHSTKTRYMVLSTNSSNLPIETHPIKIDNSNMSFVTGNIDDPAIKFLGLHIDPKLNFKYHIDTISKKISSGLYFLRSVKNILSERALKSIYYSLIHTHIIYAIQVWSCTTSNLTDRIYKLQKKAIRIVTKSPFNAHTESLFKKTAILPFPDLVHFFRLQFMQQYVQGFLPNKFANTWINRANHHLQLHNYPLRNYDELYIPPARIALTQKHPFHLFPKLWADFKEYQIRILREKKDFNFKLKEFLLEKLVANYKCNRLLCPRCHLGSLSSESDSD